ncbi:MAG: ThuA domain-containing protein, partial [Myxococcales bacterium]|nr:ThuA domain-containing protein [Myxococcales bacterium]
VFFPSHAHESVAPVLPELPRPAVLLFTKTNGFRHHEAIEAGVPAIERVAARRGWSVFHTENGAVHAPALLARFDAVVWFQTSGDVLSEPQRDALRRWIEDGGGFVGIHNAVGERHYDWRWYVRDLVGAQFVGHTMSPQFQRARVLVDDRAHPATRALPAAFDHVEEWYSFDASPRARGARVLLRVDEATYTPEGWGGDLRMGADHPVVWSHCPGRGRALLSALGHQAEAYAVPEHLALLEGAIAWAAAGPGAPCDDVLAPAAD